MKKFVTAIVILIATFLMAAIISDIAGAYSWKHIIGGGLSGTTGVPFKVDADGALYVR